MLDKGLLVLLNPPRGREASALLVALTLLFLPQLALFSRGGVILSDGFLILGCCTLVVHSYAVGKSLSAPAWLMGFGGLMLPYLLGMLIGRGLWQLQNYPLWLVKHLYAPGFAVITGLLATWLWPGRASERLWTVIALSGLVVVTMDLAIVLLAALGIHVFAPAFQGGLFPSKLVWPFLLPSQLPGFLMATYPLTAAWLWLRGRDQSWPWELAALACVLAHGVIVTMSGSRAGFAGYLLETIGLVALHFRYCGRSRWPRHLALLLTTTAATVIGLIWISESNWVIRRAMLAFQDALAGGSLGGEDFRAHNWEFARRLFISQPLFGVGLSAAYTRYGYEIHNSFLSAFAELGVLGGASILLSFVGLPLALLWRTLRVPDPREQMMLPLVLAMGGQALFAATHYVLRQRWVWMLVVLTLLFLWQEHSPRRQR